MLEWNRNVQRVYWLSKESLNVDGQPFHQYQQDEQSHLTYWTQTKNPGAGWDRHQNVAVLNWLIGFQNSYIDNRISHGNTYINIR
jgi:hypothetical protein